MSQHDRGAIARAIVDSNRYMTIATADALHSRNLATRPQVSIVVFDSRAPIGEGQAVYISAVAAELTGADLEQWILDPGDHPIHGRTGDHRTPVRP